MEVIKNYLDSMFTTLPDTSEVRKAREELYQMMEDKYLELKSEGKSENEAIGIVIAEFGSLDEIREELGGVKQTSVFTEEELEKENFDSKNLVSVHQAKEYIEAARKGAACTAVGVLLCICSPLLLIFMSGLSELKIIRDDAAGAIGIVMLFLMIAVAVALFLHVGSSLNIYEFLKAGEFRLQAGVKSYVEDEENKNRAYFSALHTIGVIFCICCAIPLFVAAFFLGEFACIVAVDLLLLLVGCGSALLTYAGNAKDAYAVLLGKGEHRKRIQQQKHYTEAISSAYWCIVTAIYLAWSFWTHDWHITWVVWPVAGVLSGALKSICMVIFKEGE